MSKKIINIGVLIITSIPILLLQSFQDSAIEMGKFQLPLFIILFLGGILLTYISNINRKESTHHKWVWIFFMLIGVYEFCVSGVSLFLIFITGDCCGF